MTKCKSVLHILVQLVRRYFFHRLGHDAAALTYYLLFAIFPLLIFLNSLVGVFAVDVAGVLHNLAGVIPRDVLDLLIQYVVYTSGTSSRTLLIFSLIFSVWFPMRAAGALLYSLRRICGSGRPKHPLRHQLRLFLFTLVFLATLLFSLIATTVGETVLGFFFPQLLFSTTLLTLWTQSRFFLLGALTFSALTVLYALALEKPSFRSIWPGVLLAMSGWVVLSLLFSLYVENAGRYSMIYGSIGAIIVLLLWLYLTANCMLIGAEFNQVLGEFRRSSTGGNNT